MCYYSRQAGIQYTDKAKRKKIIDNTISFRFAILGHIKKSRLRETKDTNERMLRVHVAQFMSIQY